MRAFFILLIELFEIVELSCLAVEDVHDHGAVVHYDPCVAVLAFDAERFDLLPAELILDLVGKRMYLRI